MSSPDPRTTKVDGREVAWRQYGDPTGVPVVFLHGTPGAGTLGAVWDDAAGERGVRLLCVDRPGCGASDPWPGRTLGDTASFVTPVLDAAGGEGDGIEQAGVVGFSGGGPHALALAAAAPGRVRQVDVLAGATPPALQSPVPTAQRVLGGLADHLPRVLAGLLRGQRWLAAATDDPSLVLGQYTDDPSSVPAADAEAVVTDFETALGTHRSGAVRELALLTRAWDVDLSAVDAPVTLTHGEADRNVPPGSVEPLAERIGGEESTAEVATLPAADHLQTLLRSADPVLERQAEARHGTVASSKMAPSS